MVKVIIKGHWAPYVGTDYCEALGHYDKLDDAWGDAESKAWDTWEGGEEDDEGFEDEGPDFYIEEYDPETHDCLRAGGGSFEDDFKRLEGR